MPDPAEVLERMASEAVADARLVNDYYTLCIPFYREFLGEHWHTGWYVDAEPPTVRDQQRMELRIADSAGVLAGSQVLDVGCGVGGPACHLAQQTGARIHGLTPNAEQLALAMQLARSRGLQEHVRFTLGSAHALPFDDASFDVVWFFESACHFPDRAQFFREAWRVLRPGGRLVGEDWLASEAAGSNGVDARTWHRRIESLWAIPALGSLERYAVGMQAAGFVDVQAVDLRDEMILLQGFAATAAIRQAVRARRLVTTDAVRRQILEGLEVLGEAAERGAFTVGRFRAVKPPSVA